MGVLILLFLVVLIGGIIAIIIAAIGRSRALESYAAMSLDELRSVAPPVAASISVTSKTVFGNKAAAWLEILLNKSFETTSPRAAREIAREAYSRYLSTLAQFLRTWLPDSWSGDPSQPTVLRVRHADGYALSSVELTIELLGELARRHNERASNFVDETRWETAIFEKLESGMQQHGAGQYTHSLETRCHPVILENEVRRLGGATVIPLTATFEKGLEATNGQAISIAAPIPTQQSAVQSVSPALGAPPQFSEQTTGTRQPQQTSGTVYGCLSAALIAAGSGLLLLSTLVMVAMSLDKTKTTRETIGGIIGGGAMILFATALIAVGVYVFRLRRAHKNSAGLAQSKSEKT